MTDEEIRTLVKKASNEVGCAMLIMGAVILSLLLPLILEIGQIKKQLPPPATTVQEGTK